MEVYPGEEEKIEYRTIEGRFWSSSSAAGRRPGTPGP